MGDVFDAMNRAKRERGHKPPPSPGAEPPVAPDSPVEPGASSAPPGDRESPSLPIEDVKASPMEDLQEAALADGANDSPPRAQTQAPRRAPQEKARRGDKNRTALPVPKLDRSKDSQPNNLNGYSPEVVVHHDRGGLVTEQYRAIRTQILARSKNRRLQTHVVTSSVPGEGKSVTTANLGVAFSELRSQNILLIEADLRRPSFHKLFDRECSPGLLQLLRGDISDIDKAIHHTVYDNLQFIPAGGRDPIHSTELLSSPRMTQILDRLKDHYDHIFIDTPPVINVTDAAILAAAGDQTLMVVRLHKTPIDMVDRAKRLLNANNCKVSGVILTHLKMMYLPRYLYRYSYGYGASYS